MPFPPIVQQQQVHNAVKDQKQQRSGAAKKSNIVPPQSLYQSQRQHQREEFSSSWPSASTTLRQLGRRPQPRSQPLFSHRTAAGTTDHRLRIPRPPAQSCDSMPASSSVDSGVKSCKDSSQSSLARDEAAAEDGLERFSLSLTPEAILVLQKRNLEKQLLARRNAEPSPPASGSLQCRRLYQTRVKGLSSMAAGLESPVDIRSIVKISLLNDQHKYDDVEYEEEEEDEGYVDECVIRKCTEWLRGVESATVEAREQRVLETLPHLSTL